MKALRYVVPLAIFVILVAFLGAGLTRDPREVPSPLVGKPAPAFELERLHEAGKRLAVADMKGQVWLLNVWASWCVSCRVEHPLLMELAKDPSVRVLGFNYKDKAENARRFLGAFGNPFSAVGADETGRTAIEFGVYGVPETFVIGRDGTIRHKHVGPLTPETLPGFMAEVRKAAAR